MSFILIIERWETGDWKQVDFCVYAVNCSSYKEISIGVSLKIIDKKLHIMFMKLYLKEVIRDSKGGKSNLSVHISAQLTYMYISVHFLANCSHRKGKLTDSTR